MSNIKNTTTIEKMLIAFFDLSKRPELKFTFSLLDDNHHTIYYFIPTHPEAKVWIMKVIRCWREKEPLSFSFDEETKEVSNIW